MMYYCLLIFHLAIVIAGPIFILGIINRVRSVWVGRRGPSLQQTWFDLVRLLRKEPVYSQATSWLFPLAPAVILATVITASLVSPVVPGFTPLSFTGDFVAFAYILGLGRVFLMLSALDTGSSFEGMGASREATYGALVEPSLLLAIGTLAWANGTQSFQDVLVPYDPWTLDGGGVRIALAAALLIVLLVEASRVPADDPATHLELTMVHEVMILDHSGPELAMVQYASGMKLTILAGIIAAILNPFSAADGPAMALPAAIVSTGLIAAIAVVIGLIESLTARLRFRALPLFAFSAFMAVMMALVIVIAKQAELP